MAETPQQQAQSSEKRVRAVAIIPARYASTRFPGKPLVHIAGRPMIEHVYRRASQAKLVDEVWVATDDARIFATVEAFGGRVLMTRDDHPSGTDRIAEAAEHLQCDVVVNVQGDEPLLEPDEIDAVVAPFAANPELVMTTAATPITDPADAAAPSVVKVVVDRDGYALYFSRLPLPYYRSGSGAHLKHLGLYAYRKTFLQRYAALVPTPLEQAEALEQLRVLENGYRILVVPTPHDAVSVDVPEDLERVRRLVDGAANGGG
ncbi:MAG TPA: 3-deoxy-manno-octulosonate cytidylyltransferase [Armatimonadota bacterium]|nr:3-deoxy-manno-octulosonate cytidylyltransferase [Armatimonadota bacterium]